MAKILRLHKGTSAAGDSQQGWDKSDVIDRDAINSIVDPEGDNSPKEITSIPSPFARMDLVRQAFKYVNKKVDDNTDNFEGSTIYHRLVSDALDVGEIFFNFDKYNKDFKLVKWDIRNLDELIKSDSQEACLWGNTLNLFINPDKNNSNGEWNYIYILKYIGKGAPSKSALDGHIIGATSPYTLFFTPARDLSYVSNNVLFEGEGNDKADRPFDGCFTPLYKRDREYIKYLVWLNSHSPDKSGLPLFSRLFSEVSDYIVKTKEYCGSDEYNDEKFGNYLASISPQTKLSIERLHMDDGSEVFLPGGYPLCHKVVNMDYIEQQSQFVIKLNSSKLMDGNLPLVLPSDNSCQGLTYTMTKWDGTLSSDVPVIDTTPLKERTLPGVNVQYPYLTIGDFLEPILIRTAFSQKSFVGASDPDYFLLGKDNGLDKYLIPIKKEYFLYFDINDLRRNLKVEVKEEGDDETVTVNLSIPIVGDGTTESVIYQRIYRRSKPTNERKFGQIVDIWTTGVTIFPHAKIVKNPDYRVTLYLAPNLTAEKSADQWPCLNFVNSKDSPDTNISVDQSVCRNKDASDKVVDGNTIISKTWKVIDDFDMIELVYEGVKNLIIPNLCSASATRVFCFAIDLGTTNTHIEYSVDGSEPKPLDITNDDAQIRPTDGFARYANAKKVQEGDLIPAKLGSDCDVAFPIRTVLTFQKGMDWQKGTAPFMQANIPFYYERKVLPRYDETPITDLKWQTGDIPKAQLENFIGNLAFIMRNKVLMNGGDLEKTQIIWFYPTSMKGRVVGDLSRVWNDVYNKYFDPSIDDSPNVYCVPEAVAPLSYYKDATTDAITIDIGGGTSDFLFAQDGDVRYISSAKFASNSLFGDGLNRVSFDNGIIKHFCEIVTTKLPEGSESLAVLNSIKEGVNASANLASFFFSLKSNPDKSLSSQERKNLDFTQMLADSPEGCSVILLFYMSLIYYCARVAKAKGLKEPRYIGFSGNGSKVLDIFFGNKVSKSCVMEITKGIFEEVLGRQYDSDGLDILQTKGNSPKEATARGGLYILKGKKCDTYGNSFVRDHSIILLGTNDDKVVEPGSDYETYGSIDSEVYQGVVNCINDFVETSKNVLLRSTAYDDLAILKIDRLFSHDAFTRDLEKYVKDGLRNESLEKDDKVTTSLFFYAIEGILHKLGKDLFAK